MRKTILTSSVILLSLFMAGCRDHVRYRDQALGADEYILDCLDKVPAGGHTEGEDAVGACSSVAHRILPARPGFIWWNSYTSSAQGPWTPCKLARREKELEACQYAPQGEY